MAKDLEPLEAPIRPEEGADPGVVKDLEKEPDAPEGETPEQKIERLEKRRRDFQVKANRLETQLKNLEPILRAIDQNPDIKKKLLYPDPPEDPDPMPKPPEKPEHFDDVAAFNDPTSESFKYRKAKEKYQDLKLEWVERREQQREVEKQRAQEIYRQRQQAGELIDSTHTQLVAEKGFTPEEATHFVAWMSDDKNVTLDNMIAFYRAVHPKKAIEKGGKKPTFGPIPAAVAGGGGNQEVDENQEFNRSIQEGLKSTRKADLFPRSGRK